MTNITNSTSPNPILNISQDTDIYYGVLSPLEIQKRNAVIKKNYTLVPKNFPSKELEKFPSLTFTAEEISQFFYERLTWAGIVSENAYIVGGACNHILEDLYHADVDLCFYTLKKETDLILEIAIQFLNSKGLQHLSPYDIQNYYLYEKSVFRNLQDIVIGSYIGFGEIQIKFCFDKTVRRTISATDGFHIAFTGDRVFCIDGTTQVNEKEFNEVRFRLRNRQLYIKNPGDVQQLTKRITLALTRGFTLTSDDISFFAVTQFDRSLPDLPDPTPYLFFKEQDERIAHNLELRNKRNLRTLHGSKAPSTQTISERTFQKGPLNSYTLLSRFTFQYDKHLENHYPNDSTGKKIEYINLLGLLKVMECYTSPTPYYRYAATAWLNRSETPYSKQKEKICTLTNFITLSSLIQQVPSYTPQFLFLIQGAFLYEWFEQNPGIGPRPDSHIFSSDHHFSLTIGHRTNYLAINGSYAEIALYFFQSWLHLEKMYNDLHGTKYLSTIFEDLGFTKLQFTPEWKKSILNTFMKGFLQEQCKMIGNAAPFFRFIQKNMADQVDAHLLKKGLIAAALKEYRNELLYNPPTITLVKELYQRVLTLENILPNEEAFTTLEALIEAYSNDTDGSQSNNDPFIHKTLKDGFIFLVQSIQQPTVGLLDAIGRCAFKIEALGFLTSQNLNEIISLLIEHYKCLLSIKMPLTTLAAYKAIQALQDNLSEANNQELVHLKDTMLPNILSLVPHFLVEQQESKAFECLLAVVMIHKNPTHEAINTAQTLLSHIISKKLSTYYRQGYELTLELFKHKFFDSNQSELIIALSKCLPDEPRLFLIDLLSHCSEANEAAQNSIEEAILLNIGQAYISNKTKAQKYSSLALATLLSFEAIHKKHANPYLHQLVSLNFEQDSSKCVRIYLQAMAQTNYPSAKSIWPSLKEKLKGSDLLLVINSFIESQLKNKAEIKKLYTIWIAQTSCIATLDLESLSQTILVSAALLDSLMVNSDKESAMMKEEVLKFMHLFFETCPSLQDLINKPKTLTAVIQLIEYQLSHYSEQHFPLALFACKKLLPSWNEEIETLSLKILSTLSKCHEPDSNAVNLFIQKLLSVPSFRFSIECQMALFKVLLHTKNYSLLIYAWSELEPTYTSFAHPIYLQMCRTAHSGPIKLIHQLFSRQISNQEAGSGTLCNYIIEGATFSKDPSFFSSILTFLKSEKFQSLKSVEKAKTYRLFFQYVSVLCQQQNTTENEGREYLPALSQLWDIDASQILIQQAFKNDRQLVSDCWITMLTNTNNAQDLIKAQELFIINEGTKPSESASKILIASAEYLSKEFSSELAIRMKQFTAFVFAKKFIEVNSHEANQLLNFFNEKIPDSNEKFIYIIQECLCIFLKKSIVPATPKAKTLLDNTTQINTYRLLECITDCLVAQEDYRLIWELYNYGENCFQSKRWNAYQTKINKIIRSFSETLVKLDFHAEDAFEKALISVKEAIPLYSVCSPTFGQQTIEYLARGAASNAEKWVRHIEELLEHADRWKLYTPTNNSTAIEAMVIQKVKIKNTLIRLFCFEKKPDTIKKIVDHLKKMINIFMTCQSIEGFKSLHLSILTAYDKILLHYITSHNPDYFIQLIDIIYITLNRPNLDPKLSEQFAHVVKYIFVNLELYPFIVNSSYCTVIEILKAESPNKELSIEDIQECFKKSYSNVLIEKLISIDNSLLHSCIPLGEILRSIANFSSEEIAGLIDIKTSTYDMKALTGMVYLLPNTFNQFSASYFFRGLSAGYCLDVFKEVYMNISKLTSIYKNKDLSKMREEGTKEEFLSIFFSWRSHYLESVQKFPQLARYFHQNLVEAEIVILGNSAIENWQSQNPKKIPKNDEKHSAK